MRLNKEYMGSIDITPNTDVVAGEFSTWVIKFKAGEYGIDDGGTMVIAWKSVSDWDSPQFDEPDMPGYTTVTTDGQCTLKASYSKFVRSFGNSILISVSGGYIKKNDTITITLGDTSKGSLGMRAQSFCEREHEIRVFLDPCGTLRYEELPERLKLKIVPAYAHEIQAILPGTVKVGEPFDIAIRALDEFGNPTGRYSGNIKLRPTVVETENIPENIVFPENIDGVYKVSGCRVLKDGFFNVEIVDEVHNYTAYSNACKCVKDDVQEKLYWGDMHGQTRQTVGTGMLKDYYSFARDKACIDFTGWQGNDFEVTNDTWKDIRKYTKDFNDEGKFLVYLGYEWSGTTPQGGDHNVYFLDDNDVIYPSSNWTATQVDPCNNANPITELHSKLEGRQDVMLIPHVGGRYANLDYFNYDYSSVIEIHSHHGTFEWLAFDAMKKRMKVGFIAASDDHTCRPGLSYPLSGHGKSASGAFDVASGFTGVFAENLTKKAIWDAIKARHCYASTFDRIYLNTMVNAIRMGDEGQIEKAPIFDIESAGTYPIESYDIYDWDKKIASEQCLKKDIRKIRIRWSGVVYRGRGKSACWDGMIYVQNGKINSAEKYAYDRIDQGIIVKSDQYVKFTSSTSGDYDGIVLEIESYKDTIIKFNSKVGSFEASYEDIINKGVEHFMGGLNLKLEMSSAYETVPKEEYSKYSQLKRSVELPYEAGDHAYWVRVLQCNGNAAWSSPIFVTIK